MISEGPIPFYDIILGSFSEGITEEIQENFSRLYAGKLSIPHGYEIPRIEFTDTSGFSTEIERAGSGVISSYSILLGLYKVNRGGCLIIEEPEAHLEPLKQMELVEMLYENCKSKGVTLFLTTHSDYLVKRILAMVSKKELRRSDLGLYYFDRRPDKFTTIRRNHVNELGEAEQPVFQGALDSLVKEFS